MQRQIAALMMIGFVAAACGGDDDDAAGGSGDERLQVVASFYPIAEAAEVVGGDAVDVTNLTPTGTEPHDLELTPDQVDELEDADLVLYLGQGFQAAVEEVVERRDGPSVDLLADLPLEEGATEALEQAEAMEEAEASEEGGAEEEEEHAESGLDPHFWLDPTLMAQAVDEIEAALSDTATDDASAIEANAADYKAGLTALDDELSTTLGTCQRRDIVTSHAAFHYLARRYGLNQIAILGLSPEAEPEPDRIAELADLIGEKGITTVFYETLVSPEVADAVAREAGVETAVLNPIEGLTDEELDDGKDYAGVMRDNLGALSDALGCT
jgi:zinc transport system substrate-binding protein